MFEKKLRDKVENIILTLDERQYFVHDAELVIEGENGNVTFPKVTTLAVVNALTARGSALLYGGYGGGKTQLTKILGRLITGHSLEDIEKGTVRAHPQLTEEKMVARLDTGDLLDRGIETVVWKYFVESFWKVIDEVNRLSPHIQDILFSLLGEGQVRYFGNVAMSKNFVLFGTINPRDVGAFRMSLPFLDRFGMAIPVTMPSFNESLRVLEFDERLHEFTDESVPTILSPRELKAIWELSSRIPLKRSAQFFISSLLKDFSLCIRVDKETGEFLERGEEICKGCHFSTKSAICNKIFTPLSVRAAKDLSRYSKALSWLLGLEAVPTRVVATLAPYILWHRISFSQRAVEEYSNRFALTKELIDRSLKNLSKRYNLFSEIRALRRGEGDLKSIGLMREQSTGDLVVREDLYPTAKRLGNDTYRSLMKEFRKSLESQDSKTKEVIEKARSKLPLQLLSTFNETVQELTRENTVETFKIQFSQWKDRVDRFEEAFPRFEEAFPRLYSENFVEMSKDGLHFTVHMNGRLDESPVVVQVYGWDAKALTEAKEKLSRLLKGSEG